MSLRFQAARPEPMSMPLPFISCLSRQTEANRETQLKQVWEEIKQAGSGYKGSPSVLWSCRALLLCGQCHPTAPGQAQTGDQEASKKDMCPKKLEKAGS